LGQPCGQNPNLEASRSIFSSRFLQNRHKTLFASCKLLLLQKTILKGSRTQTSDRFAHTGLQAVGHRWPARPERSGVSRDSVRTVNGGAERDRTADPLLAKQVLSQLSYSPNPWVPASTEQSDQSPSINTINRKPRPVSSVRHRSSICKCKWWAREDLNFRPHAYQACALTN
jgi:hypothetical protein